MQQLRHIQNPFLSSSDHPSPQQTQLRPLLHKLLKEFLQNVKIPTLLCLTSDPNRVREDPFLCLGAAGYLYTLLKTHDFFSKMRNNSCHSPITTSKIVGETQLEQV